MKKIVAIILSFVLILTFAACSNSKGGETKPTKDSTTTAAPSSPATEKPEPSETTKPAEEKPTSGEVSSDEVVIVDNEHCTFKIVGIDPDNLWGYTLKAYLENKTDDKTLMFSVTGGAINGLQSDPFFGREVAAGKKSNEEITFSSSTLDEVDIGEFTDIELFVRVYDNDDWMADDLAEESVHIYPKGAGAATQYVRKSQSSDVVMIDNDDVTVIVTGYDPDGFWGYTVNFYLINKTDQKLMFTTDDVSVNGYMLDPFYATSVLGGKVAYSSLDWSDDDFDENGITDVEEIEMKFRIYDYDDWMADDLVNELVTLHP